MPVFVPTVPASPVGPWVELLLQGEANLLSANDAGNTASGSVGTWATFPSAATLSQTGPGAPDGSFPIRVTLNGAAQVYVASGNFGASPSPAVPGQTLTGVVALQAVTTGRSFQAHLYAYNSSFQTLNSSGTPNGTSSPAFFGPFQSDFSGSYTTATVSGVMPPNTAYTALEVEIDGGAASEQHYIASRAILPGTVTTWSEGGQAGLEKATVQYSDDGTTWVTVPYANLPVSLPAPSQQATVTDWTPFPNTPRQYRTQTTDSNGKVSAWSAPISATTSPDRYWLIDVTQPDANGRIPISRLKGSGSSGGASSGLEASQAWTVNQAQSVTYGLDEQYPVVLQGAIQGMTTSLMALLQGQAAKNQLINLWKRRRTLRMSTDGYEAFWVTIASAGSGSNAGITIEMLRDLPAERRANPWWVVTMPLVETGAP